MKKFNLVASVEIFMQIEAESLEDALSKMDEEIYDRLEDVSHSTESIDED